MSTLAAELRLDNSTLTRTVEGLVRRRLVERMAGEQDRRVVRIRLTAAGRSACEAIHEENDASSRAVLRKIPASRRASVLEGFDDLVRAFLDWEDDRGET